MTFGIIGGTGFYSVGEEGPPAPAVETRYGPARLSRVQFAGQEVAFVTRHGPDHTVPPHRVNYRANIAALRDLGVTNILASASVGSLNPQMSPGDLVVLTQFLDFTRARAATLYDDRVVHVDMTEPYCPRLRAELLAAGERRGQRLPPSATYVCAEGPRFETAAEIQMFRQLGADLVGMTNVPEVVLAREAGLCYAAVALVCNMAAGISAGPIEHAAVSDFTASHVALLRDLFRTTIEVHRDQDCACRHAVEKGRAG